MNCQYPFSATLPPMELENTERHTAPHPCVDIIADITGVYVSDIMNKNIKIAEVSQARHLCAYIMRYRYDMTHRVIGAIWGNRHDWSVYACSKVFYRSKVNIELKKQLERAMQLLVIDGKS
jgi:chromosomal replication initiation ATPase DnaA